MRDGDREGTKEGGTNRYMVDCDDNLIKRSPKLMHQCVHTLAVGQTYDVPRYKPYCRNRRFYLFHDARVLLIVDKGFCHPDNIAKNASLERAWIY